LQVTAEADGDLDRQGDRSIECGVKRHDLGVMRAGEPSRRYVVLLTDPTTGEIEAFGPVDEPNAVVLAAQLPTALAADPELGEVGVLLLPLQHTTARFVASPEAPAAG
jgi:hypothetical protein